MRRIILISDGKIFLAPGRSFPISITTFPPGSISFKSNAHQYWEVDAKNDRGNLTFVISNYHPTNISSFDTQQVKGTIESIAFSGVNWRELQMLIGSYKPKALEPFLDKSTLENKLQPRSENLRIERTIPNLIAFTERIHVFQERVEWYKEYFQVSYAEARFRNGYIEFTKDFKWLPNAITIRIDNSFVREEFEAIKGYFAKAINGKKKFEVNLSVKKIGLNIIEQFATSDDVSKINETLIDNIRIATTKRLFLEHASQSDSKRVLSVDEIFDNLDEYSNVFKQSEIDILRILAEVYGLRNKRQLEYLSINCHSINRKIKFTLKPMFGFLFFIEGKQSDFYCWELLNSNATYLWKTLKQADNSVQSLIEQEISSIHEIGREQYRRKIKELPPLEFKFSFIDHKGIAVNENDSFNAWKQKIEDVTNG